PPTLLPAAGAVRRLSPRAPARAPSLSGVVGPGAPGPYDAAPDTPPGPRQHHRADRGYTDYPAADRV
ncbi:hypothetical protein ACFV2K_08325, partial [Streptomyces althioticus]